MQKIAFQNTPAFLLETISMIQKHSVTVEQQLYLASIKQNQVADKTWIADREPSNNEFSIEANWDVIKILFNWLLHNVPYGMKVHLWSHVQNFEVIRASHFGLLQNNVSADF